MLPNKAWVIGVYAAGWMGCRNAIALGPAMRRDVEWRCHRPRRRVAHIPG